MTCERCRHQLRQEREYPPCDIGGLTACRFYESHGERSPGEYEDPLDTQAIVFYLEARAIGIDALLQLTYLKLNTIELDLFLLRQRWLRSNYPAFEYAEVQAQQTENLIQVEPPSG